MSFNPFPHDGGFDRHNYGLPPVRPPSGGRSEFMPFSHGHGAQRPPAPFEAFAPKPSSPMPRTQNMITHDGGSGGAPLDSQFGGHHQQMANHIADRFERLEHEVHTLRRHAQSQQQQPSPLSGMQPQIMQVPVPVPVPMGGGPQGFSQEHAELMQAHGTLLQIATKQRQEHMDLVKAHTELLKAHQKELARIGGGNAGTLDKKPEKKKHPCLGVIRLDYNYPPAEGDIDHPGSYGYDVTFRVIPGLTFEMAQSGIFTEEVERNFADGIKYLEQYGCHGITGDCGFMMSFQVVARKIASKPVFMSSMVQCPIIATAFDPDDKILILTANGESLKATKSVLLKECGFEVNEHRFIIRGCQHVDGFDAVARGEKVDVQRVQPGILAVVFEALKEEPAISAILLECTELPPYTDAIRACTGLPCWDAITACDFYISAYKDNPRFGISDWQEEWDQEQDDYAYGDNLIEADKKALVNKVEKEHHAEKDFHAGDLGHGAESAMAQMNKVVKKKPSHAQAKKMLKNVKQRSQPVLGVVRLDYHYPPAHGDIDSDASYGYSVLFKQVDGLTFEMAQAGRMTPQVKQNFENTIKWLEKKEVAGITGDCGFMMAFQPIARRIATVPVFMSSMVQCPMISLAFDKYDKILILTANEHTLEPQKDHLLTHCGFNVCDDRFIIEGCQDVPGFDAVAKGEKVDVERVTPGIVKMTLDLLDKQPSIRAICLECTELPPYADALRQHTGLPVFDAITNCDFFISAFQDNPRFGLNEWQCPWDKAMEKPKMKGQKVK